MSTYICNAFSLNMLSSLNSSVWITELSEEQARWYAQSAQWAIGHAETSAVVGSLIKGFPCEAERITVKLGVGDCAIVAQYIGPRLPEGATSLPIGAVIKWVKVVITE